MAQVADVVVAHEAAEPVGAIVQDLAQSPATSLNKALRIGQHITLVTILASRLSCHRFNSQHSRKIFRSKNYRFDLG